MLIEQIIEELQKEIPELFQISDKLTVTLAVQDYVKEYQEKGNSIPQHKGSAVSKRFKKIVRKYVKKHKPKKPSYNEASKRAMYKYQRQPKAKIAHSLRRRLWQYFKGNRKPASTLELLGCTFEELQAHLEKQFKPGMTWDNYGSWHIDHIKPLASFDLSNSDELKIATNYQNLQPLWAIDNLRKGAKLVTD